MRERERDRARQRERKRETGTVKKLSSSCARRNCPAVVYLHPKGVLLFGPHVEPVKHQS